MRNRWKWACVTLLFCVATAPASAAQTFTTLVSFNGTDGVNPQPVSLVQGTDGNLYGTTLGDGIHNFGTIFRITPAGTLTTLHIFGPPLDGRYPTAGLVQGIDGYLYGTTFGGGAATFGTVFRITPQGTLTTLYTFCSQFNCADGSNPHGGLVQATDGSFYGTTGSGGTDFFWHRFQNHPGGQVHHAP